MFTEAVSNVIPVLLRSVRRPVTALSGLLGVLALESHASGTALIARFADGETQMLATAGPAAAAFGPLGPKPWIDKRFRSSGGMTGGSEAPEVPWSEGQRVEWRVAPGISAGLMLIAFGDQMPSADLDTYAGLAFLLGELVLSRRQTEILNERLKLERQDRALIAASLQHDLRTPLSSILGFAQILRETADLPIQERAELLDLVVCEAERMAELVSDGLRREAADPDSPLKLQSVDAEKVAVNVAEVAGSVGKCEVMVGVEPATLVTDNAKLTRALLNLVDNAVRYAPAGTQVRLNGRPDAEHYLFVIADSGPGVPDEMVQALFQPYSTDPTRSDGTGLGLYSVANLAHELGGRVSYTRREGWTMFSLWVAGNVGSGTEPRSDSVGALP